jgi:hypothetical protein
MGREWAVMGVAMRMMARSACEGNGTAPEDVNVFIFLKI